MNVDPLAKRNASYSSCYDVWKYISELGISKVNFIEKLCSPFEGVTQEPVIFTTWSNSCYSLKSLGILENQHSGKRIALPMSCSSIMVSTFFFTVVGSTG